MWQLVNLLISKWKIELSGDLRIRELRLNMIDSQQEKINRFN